MFNISILYSYLIVKLTFHVYICVAFEYTLTLEEPRVKAGLLPRATFLGGETAMKQGNLTTEVDKRSCKNFTLELRVGDVSVVVTAVMMSMRITLCRQRLKTKSVPLLLQ